MKNLNSLILVTISLTLLFSCVNSPSPSSLLSTINQTSQELRRTFNEINALTRTLKLTKSEFDKTVAVFKPGSTATNRRAIPKGQENTLKISKGKTKDFTWAPIAHFDNQLFPSVIVSMATYKGPIVGSLASTIKSNALGFSYVGKKSFVPVRYEIESNDNTYFNKCSGEFIYQTAGRTEVFMPEIPWNFKALTKQTTNKPLKIYFRLFDENGNKAEQLETVTLRSIDDCIFSFNGFSMDFMFAAYVQEQHPEIDKILREGLNTKLVKQWTGYQKNAAEVDKQITAIWRVLHERGFVYSSITDNAGDRGNVVSQAVRTFDTSLKTSQANCVDGTIVFASILKRIGINPLLVIVPGHCFLGYYVIDDAGKVRTKFLETTMLGEEGNLSKCYSNDTKNKEYIRIFKEAQKYAMSTYLKDKANGSVTIVDVNEERKRVDPIPVY